MLKLLDFKLAIKPVDRVLHRRKYIEWIQPLHTR